MHKVTFFPLRAGVVVFIALLAHVGHAAPITLVNGGFEDGSNTAAIQPPDLPGWESGGVVSGVDVVPGSAGNINQLASDGNAAEGANYVRVRDSFGQSGWIRQTTSAVIDESETYTLMVLMGVAGSGYANAAIELFADDLAGTYTTLGSASFGEGAHGGGGIVWTDRTLQVSGAQLSGLGGQSLGVRLEGFVTNENLYFDDVRLIDSAMEAVPGPASLSIGLAALIAIRWSKAARPRSRVER